MTNIDVTIPTGAVAGQGPAGPAGPPGADGPAGPQGDPGTPGTAATIAVGTVTTGAAGTSATVTNSGTSSAAVFDFTIPEGDAGTPGTNGTAATIAVGTVSTGSPGSSATVTNSGTSSAAVFDFTIPQGAAGTNGTNGTNGTAATIAVGTVTTGAAGTSATVTNSGTSSAAVFDFTIPQGDTGASGNDPRLILVKGTAGANQTSTSNTTLTAITGLSTSVTSGRRYHFKAMGQFRSAATTTGLGLGFVSPPATTYAGFNASIEQAASGTDSVFVGNASALSTVIVSASVVAANTTYLWEIEGFCQPSANGTLSIGFRSEVSGSQVSLLPGSVLIVTDFG